MTWQDHYGVVHAAIQVAERDSVVWDTVCFAVVRIRNLDGLQAERPITCLVCLTDPWRPHEQSRR